MADHPIEPVRSIQQGPNLKSNSGLRQNPNISVDANLVLIPVTVTDRLNTPVTGLAKENFKLFDEKEEQKIVSFSTDDAPLSVSVVFDCSGSMETKLTTSKAAVAEFLKTATPGDEFSLVEFSERAEVIQSFTQDIQAIQKELAKVQANGGTALLDAIHLAIEGMKTAGNPRKAVLIISDGGDNRSRLTKTEIKSLAMESDIQIFAISALAAHGYAPEEVSGSKLLSRIAEETGGRQYRVKKAGELQAVALTIGKILRQRYTLGYAPQGLSRDGKYRRVDVKVLWPKGQETPRVFWRRGYYVRSQ